MAKGRRNGPDRRLRRNRWIGLAVFMALTGGCWAYYEYCMRTERPASSYTRARSSSPQSDREGSDSSATAKKSAANRQPTNRCKPPGRFSPSPEKPAAARDTSVSENDFTASELQLPFFESDDLIIEHTEGRYTILYDTAHRQAAWVAYLLTGSDSKGSSAIRSDRFVSDPVITERKLPSATTAAYRKSGYDRGHLCPSADRTCSQAENDCTFYLSNISPQTPALNRGPWKQLEEQVRRWAIRHDSVYIVAGGVLAGEMKALPGGVSIPRYFYKAVLTRSDGEFHSVGFVFPNATRFEGGYRNYAVTVDSLETLTSIDFFHSLPDEVESKVESVYSSDFWFE